MLAGQITGAKRHGNEEQCKDGSGGSAHEQIKLMPLVQRLHFISPFR